jgi:predicted metal-binding protein
MDDVKEKRGYWKFKEEILVRTVERLWTCRKTDYRTDEY